MVGSVEKIVRSEKYGDSIFIKSTDKNGNTVIIQYYGLEEVGGNHEGGAKKYDYIEAGDMIGKVGKDGLKFKVTVTASLLMPQTILNSALPARSILRDIPQRRSVKKNEMTMRRSHLPVATVVLVAAT